MRSVHISCSLPTMTSLVDTKDLSYPNADVILVSIADSKSDGAGLRKFKVHKLILSVASPVFETMFTLPQSDPAQVQTVACAETEETLDLLLRYIYPIPDPKPLSITQLSDGLDAAMKYEVECAITSLREFLVSAYCLQTFPVGVYGIAMRHGFEAESKTALNATLKKRVLAMPIPVQELEYLSAHTLQSLIRFHGEFCNAVSSNLIKMLGACCKELDCGYCRSIDVFAAVLETDMRNSNVEHPDWDSLITSLENKAGSILCRHLSRDLMRVEYEALRSELRRKMDAFDGSFLIPPPVLQVQPTTWESKTYRESWKL